MHIAKIHRHPERAVPEEITAILAAGLVAHVGFVHEGRAVVIPLTYGYDPANPATIYLHGAPASRLQQQLVAGLPVCVTVTLVDGLVYSKDAKFHSMNYRSVVGFGAAQPVTDLARMREIFAAMTARYLPGRTAGIEYAAPPDNHLLGTQLVEVIFTEWSAKARRGGPKGPHDADPAAPGTCGVIDLPPQIVKDRNT